VRRTVPTRDPQGHVSVLVGCRQDPLSLLGVVFTAASVLQPAHAGADPGSDFLAALNRYGIDLSALMGQPISQQDAIELGQDICNDLHHGTPAGYEINQVYRQMPRITDKQSGNLVSAALRGTP
jgi:hypothetical protein